MQITDCRANDAREIVQMWRRSFEHGLGIVDPHPLEEQLRYFKDQVVPNSKVRVASEGSNIVGFLASGPECVSHLYVRDANIGQGIGSCLLELAKADSCGSLWLYTFARNLDARRFYERRGFREIARESENMWKLEAIQYRWVRDNSVG